MPSRINVRFIANRVPDGPQGYELIATKMAAAGHGSHSGFENTSTIGWKAAIAARMPWWKGLSRPDAYHASLIWRGGLTPKPQLHHVVWGDTLARAIRGRAPYTLTIHQPHESWDQDFIKSLASAAGVVVVAERERLKLQELLPKTPVRCVRVPVNTDLFRPALEAPSGRKVIVAAGKYLRNHAMLIRVAARVIALREDVEFRVVLNPDFELSPELRAQIPTERFTMLKNLSAPELADFYRSGWAACIPYNNMTASNSLCEALASGLPILTTDVGGMHSYGGRETLVMTANNDDDAMVREVCALLDSPARRNELGKRSRLFAETHLAWPVVLGELENFLSELQPA